MKRAVTLAALAIAVTGCGGTTTSPSTPSTATTSLASNPASTHDKQPASSPSGTYNRADAFDDINSSDQKTFCHALNWDLGLVGYMSWNMVKRQYVRAGYGTAKQFEAKAKEMGCN